MLFLLLNSAQVIAVAIATLRLSMLRVFRYEGMNKVWFTFSITCGETPLPSFPMTIIPVDDSSWLYMLSPSREVAYMGVWLCSFSNSDARSV